MAQRQTTVRKAASRQPASRQSPASGGRTGRGKVPTAARRLSTKALDVSITAPQVVAKRVTRMAQAGANPNAQDKQEMHRMGSEKAWAFYQSWAAMWLQATKSVMQSMGTFYTLPWQTALSPQQAAKRIQRAQQQSLIKMLDAGITPVHRTVMANAKRLRKT